MYNHHQLFLDMYIFCILLTMVHSVSSHMCYFVLQASEMSSASSASSACPELTASAAGEGKIKSRSRWRSRAPARTTGKRVCGYYIVICVICNLKNKNMILNHSDLYTCTL